MAVEAAAEAEAEAVLRVEAEEGAKTSWADLASYMIFVWGFDRKMDVIRYIQTYTPTNQAKQATDYRRSN